MLRPMSSSASRKFWAARVNREEIFLKPAGLPLFKPSVPNCSRSVVAVVAPAHKLPSELLFESLYLSERNVSRHLRNPLIEETAAPVSQCALQLDLAAPAMDSTPDGKARSSFGASIRSQTTGSECYFLC